MDSLQKQKRYGISKKVYHDSYPNHCFWSIFQIFAKIDFPSAWSVVLRPKMRWGKEIDYFSNFSTNFEKVVKRVWYKLILVKFWNFEFSDEIFVSSACSAWKALVALFSAGIQKYYVLSTSTINSYEIGSLEKKLRHVEIWSGIKTTKCVQKS